MYLILNIILYGIKDYYILNYIKITFFDSYINPFIFQYYVFLWQCGFGIYINKLLSQQLAKTISQTVVLVKTRNVNKITKCILTNNTRG